MKKLINRPEDSVKKTMEGVIYAYRDEVKLLNDDERILLTNYPVERGKMEIVTAGGSGHLPVFLGYVDQRMLGGCAVDNVFASPSAKRMTDMIKACDHGSDILYLYGNYGGDNMNFDTTCEMVEMDDVKTKAMRVEGDIASNLKEIKEKRRDVTGMVYRFKIASAAAEQMMSLDEVAAVAEKALDSIRTIGVALSPCIVPQVGKPAFKIRDDEVEIRVGIHGEKGVEVRKMVTANEMAKTLVDRAARDMPLTQGDEVSVLVNDLGTTPMEEQLIAHRCVHKLLTEKGVKVIIPHIGKYATSIEMVGLSVTTFKLDEQLKELLIALAKTPFYISLNKQSLIRRLESWVHHL